MKKGLSLYLCVSLKWLHIPSPPAAPWGSWSPFLSSSRLSAMAWKLSVSLERWRRNYLLASDMKRKLSRIQPLVWTWLFREMFSHSTEERGSDTETHSTGWHAYCMGTTWGISGNNHHSAVATGRYRDFGIVRNCCFSSFYALKFYFSSTEHWRCLFVLLFSNANYQGRH